MGKGSRKLTHEEIMISCVAVVEPVGRETQPHTLKYSPAGDSERTQSGFTNTSTSLYFGSPCCRAAVWGHVPAPLSSI